VPLKGVPVEEVAKSDKFDSVSVPTESITQAWFSWILVDFVNNLSGGLAFGYTSK